MGSDNDMTELITIAYHYMLWELNSWAMTIIPLNTFNKTINQANLMVKSETNGPTRGVFALIAYT